MKNKYIYAAFMELKWAYHKIKRKALWEVPMLHCVHARLLNAKGFLMEVMLVLK